MAVGLAGIVVLSGCTSSNSDRAGTSLATVNSSASESAAPESVGTDPSGTETTVGTSVSSGPPLTATSAPGKSGLTTANSPAAESTQERFTPLIVTALAPDPVPVKGTDGKIHLAYELTVLNTSTRPATITSIETLAGGSTGPVVGVLRGAEVVARTLAVGDYTIPPVPETQVPSGATVIVIMDAVFDTAVPKSLVHRISASFGASKPKQADFADNFPATSTEITGAVAVSTSVPTVIGPPLTGKSWVAANACCELSPHRGAMVPVGGRINGAERYAVDWSRFDLTARPIVDLQKGSQATFAGDPTKNESYFTFGQPVLAVADGEVVTVVNNLPEAPPRIILKGLGVSDLGGNRVVLKLATGVYAFYAHLKTGSVTVHPGDRVAKGQQIAQAGNSGNTTESHLHFHLMDSPLPLTATNLPFVIDSFHFDGIVTVAKLVAQPGDRTRELPLINSAIDFPDAH